MQRSNEMTPIKIIAGTITVDAELNDSLTASAIVRALPIEGTVNTWGDEIYFTIPVSQNEEPDARAEVAVGELGYWPVGKAFCIFFGPTPMSTDDQPRAASEVNIVGEVKGDPTVLKAVKNGEKIRVEAIR